MRACAWRVQALDVNSFEPPVQSVFVTDPCHPVRVEHRSRTPAHHALYGHAPVALLARTRHDAP